MSGVQMPPPGDGDPVAGEQGGAFYNLAVQIFKFIFGAMALSLMLFCLGAALALGVKGYEMVIPPQAPAATNYNVNLPPTFDITTHQECAPGK